MKKLFFIIFLMAFSFAITANAKKPKVVWGHPINQGD